MIYFDAYTILMCTIIVVIVVVVAVKIQPTYITIVWVLLIHYCYG